MHDPDAPRLKPHRWRDPAVLLITGFGSGFLRPAPGTWGSLAALALWWLVLGPLGWPVQLALTVAAFALGCWLTRQVGRRYGVSDDPAIVVDEFVGLWIALFAAPPSLPVAAAGFLLFRAFDIAKPWPVSWADRRPGVLGVMLDDVLAGGLAALVLQLAIRGAGWLGLALSP